MTDRPAYLEEMSEAERDQWIVDGYATAFSPELRLAQSALLAWASESEEGDGWPQPNDVIRFARCYGVNTAALGGLFGLMQYRYGNRLVWVDLARDPMMGLTVGMNTFSREAMRGYGLFCAASALSESSRETLH